MYNKSIKDSLLAVALGVTLGAILALFCSGCNNSPHPVVLVNASNFSCMSLELTETCIPKTQDNCFIIFQVDYHKLDGSIVHGPRFFSLDTSQVWYDRNKDKSPPVCER